MSIINYHIDYHFRYSWLLTKQEFGVKHLLKSNAVIINYWWQFWFHSSSPKPNFKIDFYKSRGGSLSKIQELHKLVVIQNYLSKVLKNLTITFVKCDLEWLIVVVAKRSYPLCESNEVFIPCRFKKGVFLPPMTSKELFFFLISYLYVISVYLSDYLSPLLKVINN